MGTTWIIIGVGVADLAIWDSKFKSFPKFFCIVCRKQSDSLDSSIVFYKHWFNRLTWFPKEVSKLLHVDLRHPARHSQVAISIHLFLNAFDCIKDDARLFVVALNREGLSCPCLAITYYCRIFSKLNCLA